MRALGILHPSHAHSAFSASVLLAASSVISGLVGLARGKYIAWVFGAGPQTDAYMSAFGLPDLMNNFLVGGAVSITFVTILNRYRESGEEDEGERVLFTVLNLMVLVLIAASIVLMFLAAPIRSVDQSRLLGCAGGALRAHDPHSASRADLSLCRQRSWVDAPRSQAVPLSGRDSHHL